MTLGPIIDNAVKAYLEEQIKTLNIKNWNGANLCYVNKSHVANQLGLTPDQLKNVAPYPPTVNIIAGPEESKGLLQKVAPYALAAIIGAASTGLGAYLSIPNQEQSHEQRPDSAIAEPSNGSVGFTVE